MFEVLAVSGDVHLGGEDFDGRVMDYFSNMYKTKTGVDVANDVNVMSKLKQAVEGAKRALSSHPSTTIEIAAFEGGNNFSEVLTRAKFEEINADLFAKTLNPVKQTLKDAGVKISEVDEVRNSTSSI